MNYWLLKTEPTVYSYSDLERDEKTVWDGVTNPYALRNIRAVNKGDLVFIYHTGEEKQVAGIAEIVSEPDNDPESDDPRLWVFEVKAKRKLKKPVTLAQVKADKRFRDSTLARNPRLSVQPMPENLWKAILEMAEK